MKDQKNNTIYRNKDFIGKHIFVFTRSDESIQPGAEAESYVNMLTKKFTGLYKEFDSEIEIKENWCNSHVIELIKKKLRGFGWIKISYTSVISANYKMAAPEILPA